MADFIITPGLRFVSRAGWVASQSLPRLGGSVPRTDRTHVIIHHTVSPDNDESPNIWDSDASIFSRMRRLQTVRPDLGLDVPYNFVAFITNDGVVICEGRGEDRTGAHTKGHNTRGIAVSFAGDFENKAVGSTILADRMPLLSNFLQWLRTDASHPAYGNFEPMRNLGTLRPSARQVFFHRDFAQTACPGGLLEDHLTRVAFV